MELKSQGSITCNTPKHTHLEALGMQRWRVIDFRTSRASSNFQRFIYLSPRVKVGAFTLSLALHANNDGVQIETQKKREEHDGGNNNWSLFSAPSPLQRFPLTLTRGNVSTCTRFFCLFIIPVITSASVSPRGI